jgi:rRNA-processing protein FCF1|tara:strand:+ start:2368 stop:2757 length:390 start_codon:yes stop_codon:yes gene_type:complete
MEKIILDTNFLLIPFQFRVDIFSEIDRIIHSNYSLFVLDKTKDELNHIIERQKGKHKDAAKFALQILEAKEIGVLKTKDQGLVDDIIIELGKKEKYIIATQDKDLKRELINQGNRVIVLRQKKTLILVE